MPKIEETLSVTFTKEDVQEVIRQAAFERLEARYPGVRREDLRVGLYVNEIAGTPYIASVSATLFSEDRS